MSSGSPSSRAQGVFIASQLLTADLWTPLIGALASRIDATVADNTRDDSIPAMARSVLAASAPRFCLFAHGMGGFVAFEILRQQPHRVARLALFNTLAPADTPAQTNRRLRYLQLVESGNFAAVVEERIPILVHPDRRNDAALIGLIRKMAEDTGPENFLRQQRAIMTRADSTPSLNAISCPTLIVFGRQDGITEFAHQQQLLQAIPNARLEIVEECGHLPELERPELVNALLTQWI